MVVIDFGLANVTEPETSPAPSFLQWSGAQGSRCTRSGGFPVHTRRRGIIRELPWSCPKDSFCNPPHNHSLGAGSCYRTPKQTPDGPSKILGGVAGGVASRARPKEPPAGGRATHPSAGGDPGPGLGRLGQQKAEVVLSHQKSDMKVDQYSLQPQMTMGNLSHLVGNIIFVVVFPNGHRPADQPPHAKATSSATWASNFSPEAPAFAAREVVLPTFGASVACWRRSTRGSAFFRHLGTTKPPRLTPQPTSFFRLRSMMRWSTWGR